MTVTLQRTLKDAGATAAAQLTAPLINADGTGVPTSVAGVTWTNTFGGTAYYGVGDGTLYAVNIGFRRAFAAAVDLTDRQFIQWRTCLQWNPDNCKTWANGGGWVMVFYDGAGHWAGYKISGGDAVWNFASEGTGVFLGQTQGNFISPTTLSDYRVAFFHLDRTRTPDYSSGTIDWTTVAGYEVHSRPTGNTRMQTLVGQIYTVDNPLLAGAAGLTTGVVDLRAQLASLQGITSNTSMCFDGVSSFLMFGGAPSSTFFSAIGFQVGNGGATTTTGTMAAGTLAFLNAPEDTHQTASPRYYGAHGYFLPGTTSRLIDVYQGASDSVTFNDQNWASSRAWGVRVRGTPGAANFTRCVFTRPSQFECAHGAFTDCLWDAPTAPVQITSLTTMTRCTVRNGTYGIQATGAAGTYSDTVALGGASTYDIQVGSGGAGTYTFPNISASTTLKIRNDSATNAVVVAIPGGISYTTSTAGGSISVTLPATYQSVTVNGLVAGSRVQIYDTSSSTELYNAVVAGTTVTWTDTVAAAANRAIRVRLANVSGATAYNFLEANIGTCGTSSTTAAVTYLANQTADAVYNANAIDGSTITDVTFVAASHALDRVYINAAGGSETWPVIYAAQCYWLFGATGIADDGAIINAPDPANYFPKYFRVKNTSGVPLTISGGYAVDMTPGYEGSISALYDTTGGSIFTSVPHVVAYATGSGPLTVSQAAQLASAANAGNITVSSGAVVATVSGTVDANLVSVKGHVLTGSGAGPYG